jgi:hypothetical protein
MIRRAKPFIVCLLLLAPALCSGQITLHALVADSATLKPISFATVRLNNSFRGTITNEQGYFVLTVSEPADSITFSIVGYNSKKAAARDIENSPVVYLSQAVQILKTIDFTGAIERPSWMPKPDDKNVYNNNTPHRDRFETPSFQGLQTFGPGHTWGFGDLKPSKEEKKLMQIKKENQNAKGYVALVNDPEVKDKLIKEYALTETQYYDHLAKFNEKNKDFIFQLDDTEVVRLIFLYFLENVKK